MTKGKVSRKLSDKGYGFLLSELGDNVFFHVNDIGYSVYETINDGDIVYFDAIEVPKGLKAISMLPELEYKESGQNTHAGIAKYIKLDHFSDEENKIIKNLSKIFYVTNGGNYLNLGINSTYKYFLIKPTASFEEQFNINKEIIVIFSSYSTFEPRTLDAIDKVVSKYQDLRLDRICSIIISMDLAIEDKLSSILKNDTEMQIVIPFSYAELLAFTEKSLIIERFKKCFYERDLFSFEAPLTKDLYFFGRRDYVQSLLNRHYSNENSGVFGLRRTGKTSILNSICRALDKEIKPWILIDCQQVRFLPWNLLLFQIVKRIIEKYSIDIIIDESNYNEMKASITFQDDINLCHEQLKSSILLLFDEIEHITFGISLSLNWKTGNDFISFWQAIRSYFQGNPQKCHFIIAGTNPMCAEQPLINQYDNPLYNQLNTDSYVKPFSIEQTKEMVNILGGYLGLYFDDYTCAQLTQDLGGHPYLIRHFCSLINQYILDNGYKKPIKITKAVYDQVKPMFEQQQSDKYCEFILNVLLTNYYEEYNLLSLLALNDSRFYSEISKNGDLATHLIGYGIIERIENIYGFKIDIIKNYLTNKNKYKKLLLTDEEKWSEISARRNAIEPELRKVVKINLKAVKGENNAKNIILNLMTSEQKVKYSKLEYNELFDPKKCEVYFYLMARAIEKNWDVFKNLFSCNFKLFSSYTTIINALRADCHAVYITNDEMNSFRGAMSWLEKIIEKII